MPDNTVTIVGNATRDPELRYTAGGAAVCSFGVAVSRRRKVGDQWEEATSFFDVTAWRDLAEHVAESITKGCRVVVVGRLEQREYEARDGSKRNVVEIVADEIAPSLRWATAQVTRTERQDSTRGAPQRGGGRPQQSRNVDPYDAPEPW